jgi:hypothetical protein
MIIDQHQRDRIVSGRLPSQPGQGLSWALSFYRVVIAEAELEHGHKRMT